MPKKQTTKINQEFQEAVKLLKDKAYLFDAIMSTTGDMISIQDLNMRIVYQNEMLKKMMGDHKGEFCYKVYERRDKICEGCPMIKAYKDGKVHKALRVGVLPDGSFIEVDNVASVLKNKQGKVVAAVEIIRDVRERERALEEIKKKTEELEKFRNIAVGRELKMIALKEEIEKLKKELEKYKK